jgi:hypothetical protein
MMIDVVITNALGQHPLHKALKEDVIIKALGSRLGVAGHLAMEGDIISRTMGVRVQLLIERMFYC